MDVHGAMVAQVDLAGPLAVTHMAWSCEKFKMEEGDDNTGKLTVKSVDKRCMEGQYFVKYFYNRF